jgi:hypothetical protein
MGAWLGGVVIGWCEKIGTKSSMYREARPNQKEKDSMNEQHPRNDEQQRRTSDEGEQCSTGETIAPCRPTRELRKLLRRENRLRMW